MGRGPASVSAHDLQVRHCVAKEIRRHGAAEIADRMAAILQVPVSRDVLYGFCSPQKQLHRFPAGWVAAFCRATESRQLLALIVKQSGLSLCTRDDRQLITFAKRVVAAERMKASLVGGRR